MVPHHGVHTNKAIMFPDASEYLQEKKPSKKVSASQTRLKKELKNKITSTILLHMKNKCRIWDLKPPQSLHLPQYYFQDENSND